MKKILSSSLKLHYSKTDIGNICLFFKNLKKMIKKKNRDICFTKTSYQEYIYIYIKSIMIWIRGNCNRSLKLIFALDLSLIVRDEWEDTVRQTSFLSVGSTIDPRQHSSAFLQGRRGRYGSVWCIRSGCSCFKILISLNRYPPDILLTPRDTRE